MKAATAPKPDISKFKAYRFGPDGSVYYGEIGYLNLKTSQVSHEAPPAEDPQWRMVRHGYGLQMYSG